MAFCKDKLHQVSSILKKNWTDHYGNSVLITVAIILVAVYTIALRSDIINGDCIHEGFLKYFHDSWHVQLGRWAVPLLANLYLHIVVPSMYIVIYALIIVIVTIFIADLWGLTGKSEHVLTAAALFVSPAIIGQMIYIHVFLTFGIALLLSVGAAYLDIKTEKYYSILISAICIAISLGLYQSYIGVTLFVMIGCYVFNTLDSITTDVKRFFKRLLKSILTIAGGLCLYWICMTLQLKHYHTGLAEYGGANSISIRSTILSIPSGVGRQYANFYKYFGTQDMPYHVPWIMLLIIAFIAIAIILIDLFTKKKYINAMIVIVAIVLIPPLANIINIIAPAHDITLLMGFQMQLTIPFILGLICRIHISEKSTTKSYIIHLFAILSTAILVYTYSLATYASLRTLEIGERAIRTTIGEALFKGIESDMYNENMPIVFLGFANDDKVQEWNPIRQYSYFPNSSVFWKARYEITSSWRDYCLLTYGVDIGFVSDEDYQAIIDSPEIEQMEDFPSQNGYRVVNGCLVIMLNRGSIAR